MVETVFKNNHFSETCVFQKKLEKKKNKQKKSIPNETSVIYDEDIEHVYINKYIFMVETSSNNQFFFFLKKTILTCNTCCMTC